jgi:hypothetical protein
MNTATANANQARVIAERFRRELLKHNNYRLLKHNNPLTATRSGYTIDVTEPEEPEVVKRRYMAGITHTLRTTFWPKYRFKGLRTLLPSLNNPLSRSSVNRNMKQKSAPPKRKRSFRKIMADALERGSIIHAQVAAYTRALARQTPDRAMDNFHGWLAMHDMRLHPATERVIQTFNEEYGEAGNAPIVRFLPIWSELPVCDMDNLRQGTDVPWATTLDLLVYDTHLQCLLVIELKTSSADFEHADGLMEAPLQTEDDSPLSQAFAQLVPTMHFFNNTYGDILHGVPVMGCVLMVRADGSMSKRYFLDDDRRRRILAALSKGQWFQRGYQKP